ncbi:hypothetical protein BE15_01790 [Sorangium cellulosum]|uniref:Uncharacterized protein n=1 Tax=Sorangium cellulosum TaxID=56 RepID=A0A150QPB3_SORCE|nr:hypothetical protein BE15_01790 [Sorangium cellulosum]
MLSPLLLLPFFPACGPAPEAKTPASGGQTFPEAVAMMCDVDRLAGLDAEADPISVGQGRSAWLAEHVESPDGIELRTMLSVKGAAEQGGMLRDEARKVGLSRCALADALERDGTGGLSP